MKLRYIKYLTCFDDIYLKNWRRRKLAKLLGFNGKYYGLKENEAWQKIYEFGKNLMPIKERNLQKKYNKIFNKNTKVIREKELKKINTDKLVPEDIIIIEKGDFVPVDGKVLEENSLEFDELFKPESDEFLTDFSEKVVYQGMRVKKGKAVIQAIRTGEATYLGSFIKKIDNKVVCETNFEKVLRKYFNIIGSLGLVFLLFGSIFSFITNETDLINRLSIAGYSGLLLFLATIPVGAILVFFIKLMIEKNILKKSNLIIKKDNTLLKAHKATVICIDERFISRNYEKYIQRFYGAGIMILVISSKGKEEIKELARKSGLFEQEVEILSGKEIDNMSEEEFYQAICNTVIFYNTNRKQKHKIIEGFNKLNIKTISIIDDIEDLPTLEYTDVGICTHDRKNNFEYEFSSANIIGTELTSIYSLVKGSCMIKNYLNHYIKYYIMFQLPVILSLLVALLSGLDLKVFYFQTLIFTILIIPLLLLLVNRDYSENKIFELKEKDKTFGISCIKFSFIGLFIGIVGVIFYILLSYLGVETRLKIGCVTILFTVIDALIIAMSRRKFGAKDKESKDSVHVKAVNSKVKKGDKKIKDNKNCDSDIANKML